MAERGVPVELDGVGRTFGAKVAIHDVSFTIRPGEVLGLLGPNGAGKTTTMRVLTGYLRPTTGRVTIDGVELASDETGRKALMGYVPEVSALYADMTVEGYLRFWARLRKLPRRKREGAVARAIERTQLAGVARARIGTLSHGYRQRASIAQALLHDPAVLVLDEPTAGLDPRQVVEARRLIAELGRTQTVLFSSHLLSEVEQLCERVVVLDQGRVVAVDEVAALLTGDGHARFEVRVDGDLAAAAKVVRDVDGVRHVELLGSLLVVDSDDPGVAGRISRAVVGAGHAVLELRTTSAGTLEDAYLKLVTKR